MLESTQSCLATSHIDTYTLQMKTALDRTTGKKLDESKIKILLALQLITALVAIPIIALVGFCEAVFNAVTCNGNNVLVTLKNTTAVLTSIVIVVLPTCFAGIFAKSETTIQVTDALANFADKVTAIWGFNLPPAPNS